MKWLSLFVLLLAIVSCVNGEKTPIKNERVALGNHYSITILSASDIKTALQEIKARK